MAVLVECRVQKVDTVTAALLELGLVPEEPLAAEDDTMTIRLPTACPEDLPHIDGIVAVFPESEPEAYH